MIRPAESVMLPLPSTRPIVTPLEFVTDPSAWTLNPPAETPPVDRPPVAPLTAPPSEPPERLPPPTDPPPEDKPRRTMEPDELTTFPDPSKRPMIAPAALRTCPSAPIE